MNHTGRITLSGDMGIVLIEGVLTLSSYERLYNSLGEAFINPKIKKIVCKYNSPGGECGGLFDLCDYIYDLGLKKPICAIISTQAVSAAYALASAGF